MLKKFYVKDFINIEEFGIDEASYVCINLPDYKAKGIFARRAAAAKEQLDFYDVFVNTAEELVTEVNIIFVDSNEPMLTSFSELGSSAIADEFMKFFMELVKNGFVPKKK
jgi:hypothetical protein